MRPIVKVMFVNVFIITVIGICNVFFIPNELKIYGNLVSFLFVVLQCILCSIVLHSPDKDSK